ncbi:glycosyltransferase [Camelliibacillus cellulosilyticus]|uniref:Glycosyltransferase n=1 Tax=Camelliibacillus cellulosilyticus TaxID=2174486 RepID=A0ABV9GSC4_9BACL
MKKKLLFVALYLQTGGVEKSLLSLLSTLDDERYEIDLCLFDYTGVLMDQIPKRVNLLPPIFESYATPLRQAIPILFKKRLFRLLFAKLFAAGLGVFARGFGTGARWTVYRYALKRLDKTYDVAVGYLDFFCNYYVMEKINAKKKIVYNHMDYTYGMKTGWPCPRLDRKAFRMCDAIVTVAESARASLVAFFPEAAKKIHVIHNTVSRDMIQGLARKPMVTAFKDHPAAYKVVTVARLVPEKGVWLALETCLRLKEQEMDLAWFWIGGGPLYERLTSRIKAQGLGDCFYLLGECKNPYPYMAAGDLYVQPSMTEAHCVAVEEAMALRRPIIATNIPAFQNQIRQGETGLIAEANAESLAGKIKQCLEASELRKVLSEHLSMAHRYQHDIDKFNALITDRENLNGGGENSGDPSHRRGGIYRQPYGY